MATYPTTIRCAECHAVVPAPTALDATTMKCGYCGLDQPVPDLEARRRAFVEEQREARLLEERRAAHALEERRDAAAERKHTIERREARSGRWRNRIFVLVSMLIAPTIIAITVFDLPARLGFGASGSDRLDQVSAQLQGAGCTVLSAVDSEYASGSLSGLIKADHQCIRVFAAGGDGHRELSLRLFSGDGKEVAKAGNTTDPQLTYCAPTAETLRYEIGVGPAGKGRLSHMVLSCPAEAEPPAAAKAKADAPPR